MKFVSVLMLFGLLLCQAWADTNQYDFIIQETPYTRLCSSKNILTVNGQFPGPTIYARKGDTVIVNVQNQGDYNITLHWHGLRQPRNPWSDGPEYITQCPIQPGTNFTYNLLFSEEEGTIWWHAHSDWDRATVHGAIIIHPQENSSFPFPTPYKEIPIILGEWWKSNVSQILADALRTGGAPNISDAFTINGQPGDLYPCSSSSTFTAQVEYNQTYLLRIINAAVNNEIFFAVAGHALTVVGTDASYTKPYSTDFIMITPGQTFDALLLTNATNGSLFYMAASSYGSASRVPYDTTTTTAILQYNTSLINSTDTPILPTLPKFNDTTSATDFVAGLRSLASDVDVPQAVDQRMTIAVSVNLLTCEPGKTCGGANGDRFAASLNNLSFVTPTTDVLEAYYKNISFVYGTGFPADPPAKFNYTGEDLPGYLLFPRRATEVRVVEYNTSLEIVFQGTNVLAAENHPMHIHGYSFYVVGRGFGNFDEEKDPLSYNLVDPPIENTVGVPKSGWAAIRFRATNPGVWFIHCHVDAHTSWGMDTVIIVKNGEGSNEGMFAGFLLLFGLLVWQAWGDPIQQYDFNIQETFYTRLCQTKKILTVNGQFPGPTLIVQKGDTILVNVHNQADYNITIHWHGLVQPRNPWSDGPAYITQCPIQPGASFTYQLIFSEEEGTIWWHAHIDWDRATVHGAIIIHPQSNATFPFPTPQEEIPIILGEWWKGNVSQVIADALRTGGAPNISDAYTINGEPGDLYPCSQPNTFIANVEYSKTYLLRVINAALNNELFFAIANHPLTVVAKDASYLKPFSTDFIMIAPGQTIDVLLVANNTNGGQYYMAAHNYASAEGVPNDTTTTTAILQYNFGNLNLSPVFPSSTLPNHTDNAAATEFVSRLRSLGTTEHPVNVPQTIGQRLLIAVAVNLLTCEPGRTCSGPNDDRFAASLNNQSFVLPSIDVLDAYYKNISGVYRTGFPAEPPLIFNFTGENLPGYLLFPRRATEVRVVEYNTSVEIVFQGTTLLAAENHPLHLHGFSFYVVGRGFGNFDEEKDPLNYNLVDPPYENTVGVPRSGWVALRFWARNPGVWFMHCHLDQHTSWGMETVLIVKNGTGPDEQLLPPPSDMPPC
ncbi:hypothetical protein KFK09_000212 [Dendrobium nobile]|uniref:Laccase n=1 Tax=Dendrobium nobile TaxID=94219 RepID=A0A8T3CAN6_DENNO|nr:hypothetical protein KFK09_000212 [Dendrobium nobile]